MVSNCANPKCAKPLHYLRDGRIFVFDVQDKMVAATGKRTRRIEHFWLCGACSQTMAMQQSTEGVHVVLRPQSRLRAEMTMTSTAMAS
ncbi:MAG TPA: hypothetical protein VHX60_07560 [Acidobacteriaceae bacterium]|jgi:hypothetical protein|nr:hypothetical protein [Acidobacteriaceae bacterium]